MSKKLTKTHMRLYKTQNQTYNSVFLSIGMLAFCLAFVGVCTETVSAQTSDVSDSIIIWPEIKAQSAFVYNPVNNTILYAKNPDIQRPTASLLKIMTAATANTILNSSPILAQKQITILKTREENIADKTLKSGSAWFPPELIQYMLIGSSNKAAESLASGLIPRSSFISLMNFQARRMGLTQTYFSGPSGLDGEGISTAREISYMFWKTVAENPGLLDITNKESAMFKNALLVNNTNKMIKDLPIVFGKTGFTESAGGNLAVIVQANERAMPYVIVVLGSTVDERYSDVALLASTTARLELLQNRLSYASTSLNK